MDLLGNSFDSHIVYAFELPFAKLASFSVEANSNNSHIGMNMTMGPKTFQLNLTYYIDQVDQRPNVIVLGELEKHISIICHQISAVFINRSFILHENGTKELIYKLKLNDYERFFENIQEIGRKAYEIEFTQALEEKLREY